MPTASFELAGHEFNAINGGKEIECGWLVDKFGVPWQLTPVVLREMLMDKDQAKANRVMQAMIKMVRIDIAALQRAYDPAW